MSHGVSIKVKDEASLIKGVTEININYVAQIPEYKIDLDLTNLRPYRLNEECILSSRLLLSSSINQY